MGEVPVKYGVPLHKAGKYLACLGCLLKQGSVSPVTIYFLTHLPLQGMDIVPLEAEALTGCFLCPVLQVGRGPSQRGHSCPGALPGIGTALVHKHMTAFAPAGTCCSPGHSQPAGSREASLCTRDTGHVRMCTDRQIQPCCRSGSSCGTGCLQKPSASFWAGGVGMHLSSLKGISTAVRVTARAWKCTAVPCVDAETE